MEKSLVKTPLRKLRRRGTKRSWRLKQKLKLTWKSIKIQVRSHLPGAFLSTKKRLTPVKSRNQEQELAQVARKICKITNDSTSSLAFLLQLPKYSATDFLDRGDLMTPAASPRENISKMWRELHGSKNWENILDPLHPWLRREITKYGEFVESVYDSLDFDPLSEFCGSCRYNRNKLFEELGLTRHGYKVTKYIYAMSHVDVPQWFLSSSLGETWSKDSNWMGFVAVSGDRESLRIGRRDIVVAWRGTVTPTEWFMDLRTSKEPFDCESEHGKRVVKVQSGFFSIYNSKSELARYNKESASEQTMEEVKRHVGTQLKLDVFSSPYVKRDSDLAGSHNLEVYLHVLDGFHRKKSGFRVNARRDVASVNKSTDMLLDHLRIPECWYQVAHKGLILNKQTGRWVKPVRAPEDIPSPLSTGPKLIYSS
ncbi:hypothetical protein YC2023_089731 [Brassica napus]